MNLVLLNSFDDQGGAAIATYRIHKGLRSIGVNTRLLVQEKKTDDATVIGPTSKLEFQVCIKYFFKLGFYTKEPTFITQC